MFLASRDLAAVPPAGCCAPASQGCRDVHEDGRVAHPVQPVFEKERRIENHAASGGGPELPPDPPANDGVNDAVELPDRRFRPEGKGCKRGPIHASMAQDTGTPLASQEAANLRTLQDLVSYRVGVHHPGSPLLKERCNRAFATADATGKTKHETFHRGFFAVRGTKYWGTELPI